MKHPGSITLVSLDDARRIIAADVPSRAIRVIIWHHFYRPSAADYRGERTMKNVRRYHIKDRGWKDVGYNWLLGPNGDIWTGRTLQWSGAHTIGHNRDSVGIGMCLNGDEEPLEDFPAMREAMLSLTLHICGVYGLHEEELHFHRDFASKSCPGKLLDRDYYRALLKDRFAGINGMNFQAEDGIRDSVASRGLGDVYKRQVRWRPVYAYS